MTVHATVRHGDTGWDHDADCWDVLAPDGRVPGVRTLHHPYVDEQPFTRSRSGVAVPPGVLSITVCAHDLGHGLGGRTMTVPHPE